MTAYRPEQSTTPEIPVVVEDVFGALRHDRATDPTFDDRHFHDFVEQNTALARQTVIEAYKRSGGSPEKQYSFVEGALFIITALERQLTSDELAKILENPTINGAEPLTSNGGGDA